MHEACCELWEGEEWGAVSGAVCGRGFHRVEVENFESDTVRRKRTLLFIPGMTGIGRIPELFGGGDKIGSVVAE